MRRGLIPTLLIANADPPEDITGATRPYHFARYLPLYGYAPVVVAGAYGDAPFESNHVYRVPAPDQRGLGLRARELVMNSIRRVAPYEDRLPWIPYVVDRAGQLLRSRDIPVIFSTSPPLSGHLAAMELKRRH